MMLLPDVWRKLKLLCDDPTEHLERSLTLFWAKDLPETMEGYPLAWSRFRRKKAPSWLSRMWVLLECGDWRRTNRQASKKRRQTIPGSWARVQSASVCVSYVSSFWGDRVRLDNFLQMYAVEKTRIEARRRGHQITEQVLEDGSIKMQIGEGVS
jgi:hypothetical protein